MHQSRDQAISPRSWQPKLPNLLFSFFQNATPIPVTLMDEPPPPPALGAEATYERLATLAPVCGDSAKICLDSFLAILHRH